MAANNSPSVLSAYEDLVDRCLNLEASYVKLREELREVVEEKRREENFDSSIASVGGEGGCDMAARIEESSYISGYFAEGSLHKTVLESMGHAVHVCNASTGELIYWNRSAETLYGWKDYEVLGQSLAELLVTKEHCVPLREIMEQVCSGQTWSGQFPLKNKSGKLFMALVTKSPLYDDGELAGVITVSSDAAILNSRHSENMRNNQDRARIPRLNLKKIQWHPRPPVIPIPQIASSVSNMASKILSRSNGDGTRDAKGDSSNKDQSASKTDDINLQTPNTLAAKVLRKIHGGQDGGSTFKGDDEHGQQNGLACQCTTDVKNQGKRKGKINSFLEARRANSNSCGNRSGKTSAVNCPVQSSIGCEECFGLAKSEDFSPSVGHLEVVNDWDPRASSLDAMEIEDEAPKQPDGKQFPTLVGSTSSRESTSSKGENESNSTIDCEIQWENLHLGEEIGQGSYAIVYRGIWNGSDVAVKVYFGNEYKEETLQDYKKEIDIMKKLRHPNVLLFMGAVYTAERLAIVTEFLPRGSLFKALHKNNQALDMKRRLRIALDVARGMNYLHHRNPPIVHRDLKSSNLLVDKTWNVKVGDFGLSKWKNATFLTAKSGRGTPQWMAPEVLRNEPSNEKSDVFSFGVILWELMTVSVPWSNLNSLQVVGVVGFMDRRLELPKGLDPRISSIVQDCWQSNPEQRPSFEEIIRRMTGIIHGIATAPTRLPSELHTEEDR